MSGLDRRSFVAGCGSLALGTAAFAAPPKKTSKGSRATDGDDRYEPNWKERLTLTVGQKKGELRGNSDKVIQAAIDYVAKLGGGTVKILPGKYTFRNAVHLRSNIRLLGSGPETILTKIPSTRIALSEDSDWYDQEITLSKKAGFKVGDGVVIQAGGSTVIKRTLVAASGNRFKLNKGLRKNVWLSGKPTCASLFPLLTSEFTQNVVINNLTLDGNRKNNENFNGNYGGNIFLQDCRRYKILNVISRNYNGDGISFQICHDVHVEGCHSHDNADLGVHPGSGSQRPKILNCKLERNTIGLFWCWGVKHGIAQNNKMIKNRNYGISIGHNDTDNVMRHNTITDSGKVGILFRNDARGKDFWANRNVVENNQIINSGPAKGIAIDIQGKTHDVKIIANDIRENRAPMDRIAIRISKNAKNIKLSDNKMNGFKQEVVKV